MAFNLETCRSKDELESFALQMFNVELDKWIEMDNRPNVPADASGHGGGLGFYDEGYFFFLNQ